MLKKELAELLKNNKDDDNIDEILGKAEPVKALVNSGLTLDAFKSKIETDSTFKSYLDSEKDKHSTKSLETWKTNNLQKLIDDAVAKANPQETPEQKKIRELEERIEKSDKESKHKDLTNMALKTMTEKKLPADLVNFIVGQDEDSTNKNLEALEKVFASHDEAIKTEILKGGTYKPGGQGGAEPTVEATQAAINAAFGIK